MHGAQLAVVGVVCSTIARFLPERLTLTPHVVTHRSSTAVEMCYLDLHVQYIAQQAAWRSTKLGLWSSNQVGQAT